MPQVTPPNVSALHAGRRRILVTGGAGFNCCAEAEGYGGAVVRRLLAESEALVFNLDKCGYTSDLTSIEQVLAELGPQALDAAGQARHTLLRVDLSNAEATADAVRQRSPRECLAQHVRPGSGAHQLLQQRRPLAVRREADPCGDPQGGGRLGVLAGNPCRAGQTAAPERN